ncbi:MAG: hypothetical protein K0S05_2183 [Agromyces sp.]|nr:hypothetical protein [Agromyces sp.]
MDLIDEEHLARHERAEHGREVAGVLDGGAARHAQRPAALVRDDHGERGLAETGRAGQQDVIGCALLQRGRREEQLQLAADAGLPDELPEAPRTQGPLERELGLGREHRVGEVEVLLAHVSAPARPAGPGRAATA